MTISMPDNLKRMIKEYNNRHPFETLNISKLAQKAVFEKIKAEDPEMLTMRSTQLPQIAHNVKELPAVQAREILLEEELAQPSQEETQQHTLEVVCAECGKQFTAKRATRKFCSGKCKTAYGRKSNK